MLSRPTGACRPVAACRALEKQAFANFAEWLNGVIDPLAAHPIWYLPAKRISS